MIGPRPALCGAVRDGCDAAGAVLAAVTAAVGEGPSRVMPTCTPPGPDPASGQFIIRAESVEAIPALRDDLAAFARDALPRAETRVQQIIHDPPVGADVEVRLSGPAPDVLRDLSDQGRAVLDGSDLLQGQRIDWRERGLTIRPAHAEGRAESLGGNPAEVAAALAPATAGIEARATREGERSIPILVRSRRDAFSDAGRLPDQIVQAPAAGGHVALQQVIDGFEVQVRDTAIQRRHRTLTISVQSFTLPGVPADRAFGEVRGALEAIELPPGYRVPWGGEFGRAREAQERLGRQMPPAFGPCC